MLTLEKPAASSTPCFIQLGQILPPREGEDLRLIGDSLGLHFPPVSISTSFKWTQIPASCSSFFLSLWVGNDVSLVVTSFRKAWK